MELLQAYLPLIILITLWIGLSVFMKKKIDKHQSSFESDVSRPSNNVTLIRGVDPTNYMRSFSVILDGNSVTSIKSGETIHIPLTPGEHTIRLKVDWCRSEELTFSLNEGTNTELHCGSTYNDWRCMIMPFIKPSSYVYVRAV